MIQNIALYSPAKLQNNQLVAAECFDDTNNYFSNFSFNFLTSHDCSNQKLSYKKDLDSVNSVLKQMN